MQFQTSFCLKQSNQKTIGFQAIKIVPKVDRN